MTQSKSVRVSAVGLSGLLFATLLVAADQTRAPVVVAKPDAFRTLVNPDCSHCKDEAKRRAGQLRDDDRVLCWIRGKYQGGAIPHRFYLSPYRVISDTYGVFVYDADAGFVRGYEPSLDFDFYGWRNGVMVMRHKDGTLYSTLTGQAFDGPNKGKHLKPIATIQSDWGAWMQLYPDAVAYKMYDKYQPVELPTKPNEDSVRTRPAADPRLPASTEVLGVRHNGKTRAYPLSVIEKAGVLNDEIGGDRIAIFWCAPTRTAVAYKNPNGSLFSVELSNPKAPFMQKSDPSVRYDITGRPAGSKELDGLPWIDSVQVRWFAWAAEYPGTEVYVQK